MEILINGIQIDFTIEDESTLGEILGALEAECETSKMTITGISIDGKIINAEQLDTIFSEKPQSTTKIELQTLSGESILAMLKNIGGSFLHTIKSLQEISVKLQTGKELEVMDTINIFSTDLHQLYKLIPLLPLTGIDPLSARIEGENLSQLPNILAPLLEELLDGLKNKDTVLVGDLCEYELAPKIERIGTVLSSL